MSWMILADLFKKLVSVFFFAYLSRSISLEENGWYGAFLSILPILLGLNNLGIPDIITREVAQEPSRIHRLMTTGMLIQFLFFLTILPLAWVAALLMGYPTIMQLVVVLAAIAALERSLVGMQVGVLTAHEAFKLLSWLTMATHLLTITASITALSLGYGIPTLLCILLVAYALEWIICMIAVRRVCTPFTIGLSRSGGQYLIQQGGRRGMAMMRFLCTTNNHIDLPLLHVLVSPESAGVYAVGTRFSNMLVSFLHLHESISYPILSRKVNESSEAQVFAVIRFMKFMALVALPMGVGATLLAPELISLFFGVRYLDGTLPLIVLIWVLAIQMLMRSPDLYLRARLQQNWIALMFGVALILKIFLAWWLVPQFGIAGLLWTSLGTTIALFISMLLLSCYCLPELTIKHYLVVFWRPLIASLCMAIVLWISKSITIFLLVPLGAAVYCGILLLLGTLDDFDRAIIRGVFPGKRIQYDSDDIHV